MRHVHFFKLLCSPLISSALFSLGLTHVTGSPSILTPNQEQVHPSSCASPYESSLRLMTVSFRTWSLTTMPLSGVNQLIQQATPTVLVPVVDWRKMSQAQRGHGFLTSGVRTKATRIATMTRVTTFVDFLR